MRTLAVNLGNTSLFGGVFSDDKLIRQFRVPINKATRSTDLIRDRVDRVVICSVVPKLTKKISAFLGRKFEIVPQLLTAEAPHGLKSGYREPRQLGTDRIAAALGARKLFPRQNCIVIDCGTATTVTALGKDGTVLGGAIFPGAGLWSEMLTSRTAQLPAAKLRRPAKALGRSTESALESGLFHGHTGAIRELVAHIRAEAFRRSEVAVIGTGGHAGHFAKEKIFDVLEPALVLIGLNEFSMRLQQAQGL